LLLKVRKLLIPPVVAGTAITVFLTSLPGRNVPAGAAAPNTDAYGDPLPPGAVARLGTVRLRPALCLAFSPDGKTLATGEGGAVRLWQTATGKQIRQFTNGVPRGGVAFLAFSPDSLRLAAMDCSGMEVGVWNVRTGRRLISVSLPERCDAPAFVSDRLAFTPDGGTLLVGYPRSAYAFDAATGKEVASINPANRYVRSAGAFAFSPDGSAFAVAPSRGNSVPELWSRAGRKPLFTLQLEVPEKDGVQSLTYSHDGRLLAACCRDGTSRVWDAKTGKEIYKYKGPEGRILSVAFAPDDRALAVVGDAKSESTNPEGRVIRVWDLAEPASAGRVYPAPGFGSVSFSPDGKTLAGIRCDNCARLIDRATGKDLYNITGHLGAVTAIAYAPDGKMVASAGIDHSVRLWDAGTGRQVRVLEGHSDLVFGIAFSPDGRWLASGGRDGALVLWETATGQISHRDEGLGRVLAVAFAPDGKSFASGTADGPVRMWNVPTGKPAGVVEDSYGAMVAALAFSPDGRLLACGGEGVVRLRDAATGRVLRILSNQQETRPACWDFTWSLAFSPDGKTLASDSDEGIVLWETATGRVRKTLPGKGWVGNYLAFSPDGRLLAFGSTGWEFFSFGPRKPVVPVAHVWDVAAGVEAGTVEGHGLVVFAVAFSPDGTRLATGSMDSTALIWDLASLRRNWSRWTGRTPAAPAVSGPKDLEAARAALAGDDAAKAYRAIQALASSPGQAIPFLRRSLKPVQAQDPVRVAALLNDLNSDRFETRERASAALQQFEDSIEGALRKRLAENPAAEADRRIRLLLERIESASDSEGLYTRRAVEALELSATDDARRLLQELAGGAEGARLTREAGQALQRLKARDGRRSTA
jgi:WD40 repeat protein